MIAIDTNIVVRLIVADDDEQVAKARRLLSRNTVWIPATVALETEWVLRSVYKLEPERIAPALTAVLGLENVEVENATLLAAALTAYAKGMDFADAMHLAHANRSSEFATFDIDLRRTARSAGGFIPVTAP